MNVILLKLSPQHSRLTIRKEGIARLIYFFHQKFYQVLFDLYKFNRFLSPYLRSFTAEPAIHQEKKSLSSAMTTE